MRKERKTRVSFFVNLMESLNMKKPILLLVYISAMLTQSCGSDKTEESSGSTSPKVEEVSGSEDTVVDSVAAPVEESTRDITVNEEGVK